MSDYIERQDAVDAVPEELMVDFMDEFGAGFNSCRNEMLRTVEALPPADVVQVVRCEDCKYYGSRRWCELHSSVFDDNAFCSYGEREE